MVGLALFLCVGCALREEQAHSLLVLYNATSGSFWTHNDNWDNDYPCGDSTSLSSWYGITCDEQGESVIGISLQSNNLSGSLPDLQLPELEDLLVDFSTVPFCLAERLKVLAR